MSSHLLETIEGKRLADRDAWLRWGPYLAERQWGTVREDYSATGDAWNYFPYDHARSRAYRWGEDGIAGFTDDRLRWCLSLALWNGRDRILKERMFGLTNAQGNHGEDVKELYYFLDGTPTHSYMRMLYKYPQAAFPYEVLIAENARRGLNEPEYELLDTGIFDEGRYFDVTVEYAKATPDDILIRITIDNRGPEAADLHVLPQLWARNTWDWRPGIPEPTLSLSNGGVDAPRTTACRSGGWTSTADATWLFCRNETNYGFCMVGCGRAVQGRHQRLRRRWADRRRGSREGHQMRGPCEAGVAGGRAARSPAALASIGHRRRSVCRS